MTLWEMADLEKIRDLELVKKMVVGLESKPHTNHVVANLGTLVYIYEKALHQKVKQKNKLVVSAFGES